MSLESATTIAQLVASNPTPTDPKSQGDDHLRLIKSVLQNSFPNFTGPIDQFYVKKTGDTMTGNLTLTGGRSYYTQASADVGNAIGLYLYNSGGSVSAGAGALFSSGVFQYAYLGVGQDAYLNGLQVHAADICTTFPQGTQGNSLTRRDAVVLKSGSTMTGALTMADTWSASDSVPIIFDAPFYPAAAILSGTFISGQWVGATLNINSAQSFTFRDSGSAYAPVSWLPTSDGRVKTDRAKISDALSKLSGLTGYTYGRSDIEGDKRYGGLIAQEVEALLPEAVSVCGSGNDKQPADMKALDYNAVTALLVEAVKELKAEFEAYKAAHP